MTPKQYLRQAYRLNELINSHIREVEQLGFFQQVFQVQIFQRKEFKG